MKGVSKSSMSFFYITFLSILGFSFDLQHPYKKDARWFLFLLLYCLLLLNIVFLLDLPDINAYCQLYTDYQQSGIIDNHSEIGYRLISKIFAACGVPFYVFRTFIITFSVLLFFKGVCSLTENFSIALLFFYTSIFVISYLIQVRTGLGLSLFIGIGLPAYKKQKHCITFLSIILACLFHTSMIMLFLPFIFLALPNKKNYKLFFILILLFMGCVNLFDIILDFARLHFQSTKLISYINASGNKNASFSNRDILSMLLLYIFAFKTNNNSFDNLMYWSLFSGALLKIVFRNFSDVGTRFSLLFQYPLIFLMPLFVDKRKTYFSWLKIALIIIFCFANFYFWISHYGNGEIIANSYLRLE